MLLHEIFLNFGFAVPRAVYSTAFKFTSVLVIFVFWVFKLLLAIWAADFKIH